METVDCLGQGCHSPSDIRAAHRLGWSSWRIRGSFVVCLPGDRFDENGRQTGMVERYFACRISIVGITLVLAVISSLSRAFIPPLWCVRAVLQGEGTLELQAVAR